MQTESMDVLYYFDFVYQGNHDEVVAEALASGTPLEGLVADARVARAPLPADADDGPGRRLPAPVPASPSRRGPVPTRCDRATSPNRRFRCTSRCGSSGASSHSRRSRSRTITSGAMLDELVNSYVIPNVINPLAKTISTK